MQIIWKAFTFFGQIFITKLIGFHAPPANLIISDFFELTFHGFSRFYLSFVDMLSLSMSVQILTFNPSADDGVHLSMASPLFLDNETILKVFRTATVA